MSASVGVTKWGVAEGQLSNGQRWMSFASLFFFAFTTMFCMLKCAPVLTYVGESFGMGLDSVGNVMGFFSIAGMIVAFPGVWVMRNLGVKFTIILTAVITLIGTAIGYFATSAGMFLFSRVLEGVGMGFAAAIGPNVMPRLFNPKKLGLVMGVWSGWTCPGILIATIGAPIIFVSTGSWRSLWMLALVLELISLIWMLVAFRMNAQDENELAVAANPSAAKPARQRNYLLSGIVAGLSFTGYGILFGMINNLYPTYMQMVLGSSIAESTIPATGQTIIALPMGIAIGVFLDKTNLRKWTIVVMQALMAVVVGLFAWNGSTYSPTLVMVVVGIVAGCIPVAIRTIIPFLITDTRKMDYALGVMAFVTNVAVFVTGPYGALVDSLGWHSAATHALFPIGMAFAVLCLVLIKSDRKILREEEAAS